jgi:subtilase family serine protease
MKFASIDDTRELSSRIVPTSIRQRYPCYRTVHWRFGLIFLLCLALLPACNLPFTSRQLSGVSLAGHGEPVTPSPYHPNGSAPSTADCLRRLKYPCYSPEQIQEAYNITPLLRKGLDGRGQTIVIVESFGSPTLQQDLTAFDIAFGLPAPPHLTIAAPIGAPKLIPSNSDQQGWAMETTLDVEWAHAIAPGASIAVLVSPVSETEGVQGFPEFLRLDEYALSHHLGFIFSESWGASEPTLEDVAGRALIQRYDMFYTGAEQQGATFFASTGDTGAVNETAHGGLYSYRDVIWPASDPRVTAVGGTIVTLDPKTGAYQGEVAWNSDGGAGGGGVSVLYSEPEFQRDIAGRAQLALAGQRGIPDVAWPAVGFLINFKGHWDIVGGTSAGAPPWAGLLAIADQMAGHPLGNINPALYALHGAGFHDITHGNNNAHGVIGYPALPGWDLVTGWGTPDAAVLLPLLVKAAQAG